MDIDKHASQKYNGTLSISYQHNIMAKMINATLKMSPTDMVLTFSWIYGFLNESLSMCHWNKSSTMCHWNMLSLCRLCGTILFLNKDKHPIKFNCVYMLDLLSGYATYVDFKEIKMIDSIKCSLHSLTITQHEAHVNRLICGSLPAWNETFISSQLNISLQVNWEFDDIVVNLTFSIRQYHLQSIYRSEELVNNTQTLILHWNYTYPTILDVLIQTKPLYLLKFLPTASCADGQAPSNTLFHGITDAFDCPGKHCHRITTKFSSTHQISMIIDIPLVGYSHLVGDCDYVFHAIHSQDKSITVELMSYWTPQWINIKNQTYSVSSTNVISYVIRLSMTRTFPTQLTITDLNITGIHGRGCQYGGFIIYDHNGIPYHYISVKGIRYGYFGPICNENKRTIQQWRGHTLTLTGGFLIVYAYGIYSQITLTAATSSYDNYWGHLGTTIYPNHIYQSFHQSYKRNGSIFILPYERPSLKSQCFGLEVSSAYHLLMVLQCDTYVPACNTTVSVTDQHTSDWKLTVVTGCAWLEPMIQIIWDNDPFITVWTGGFILESCISRVNVYLYHHYKYFLFTCLKLFQHQHLSFYHATILNTTCKIYQLVIEGSLEWKTIKSEYIWKANNMDLELSIYTEPHAGSWICDSHIQFRSIDYMPIVSQWDPLLPLRVHLWNDMFLPNPVCTHHYCYYRHNMDTKYSWLTAHAFCQKQNADLISLNSFEEYGFVMDMLRTWAPGTHNSRIHIGLTQSVGEF